MKAQFTPGPWCWHTSNSWLRLKRDDHGITENVLEPFVHWRDQHPDCTVNEENMALIAAAPDLYDALDALLEWHESDSTSLGALSAANYARQILAKARGES